MPIKKHAPDPDIARRIRHFRKVSGLKQYEVVERLATETTVASYGKWERGAHAVDIPRLRELAEVFGVSIGRLLSDESDVRTIPVAGRISAGNWREAVAMSDETIQVADDLRGANLFALRAHGDSMDLIVPDGGHVIIDPDDRDLVDKGVYAVMNGDSEATLKQFCSDPPQLLPCSTNPQHKPIPIGREPLIVIGRMIMANKRYR